MSLTPEQIAGVRADLALSADVPDAEVAKIADYMAGVWSKVTAERQAREGLEADAARLEAENARLEERAVALSADAPRAPDPVVAAMYGDNIAAKREAAIAAGALSEAQAKLFDALVVDAAGTPTALALSATGPARRPFGFELWDRLAQLGRDGVRTGNAAPRGAVAAVALDGGGTEQKADPNRVRELRNLVNLPAPA